MEEPDGAKNSEETMKMEEEADNANQLAAEAKDGDDTRARKRKASDGHDGTSEADQKTEDAAQIVVDFVKRYAITNSPDDKTVATAFAPVSSLEELSEFLTTLNGLEACDNSKLTVTEFDALRHGLLQELAENKSLKGKMLKVDSPFKIPPQHYIRVRPNKEVIVQGRDPPILVMGSSGSGKTSFTVGVLPLILNEDDPDRFFVYMRATTAFNDRKVTTPKDAGAIMKAAIEEAIRKSAGTDAKLLTMVVIVDEVGLRTDAAIVDGLHKLNQIEQALDGLAKKVLLVLSGTGLDQITSTVNSEQGAVKIRLAPWDCTMVDSYIDTVEVGFQERKQLKELIRSTPLYASLGSNPRALSHLKSALSEQLKLYDQELIDQDFVVAKVTAKYVADNGLAALSTEEKRLVTMIVWRALAVSKHGCTELPDLTTPPECECNKLKGEKIEACCHSLLDVHLEMSNNEYKLTEGQAFSVSITSAISLVLFSLTGNMASLCRNWDQFETVTALHALQMEYVSAYPNKPRAMKVVTSPTQFPGTKKDSVRVPTVDKSTILVNGAKAEYADVICFDRLRQAKYAEGGIQYTLKLATELKKCGVTKHPATGGKTAHKSSRTITALLRKQWGTDDTGTNEESANAQQGNGNGKKEETFPGETRHGAAVSKLLRYSHKRRVLDHEVEQKEDEVEQKEDANQIRHINVDFVTNATKFHIPANESGIKTDQKLMRRHVDENGELKDEVFGKSSEANKALKNYFQENLLEGVSVRFFFLGQDET